jgi:hypothetical protein
MACYRNNFTFLLTALLNKLRMELQKTAGMIKKYIGNDIQTGSMHIIPLGNQYKKGRK